MRTEQEIVLQKKTIIVFALTILASTMGILNFQKNTVYATSKDENVTRVYNTYVSDAELFTVKVVGDVEPVQLKMIDESESKPGYYVTTQISTTKETETVSETSKNVTVASRGCYVRDTNAAPTDYEKVVSVRATAYCLCQKCCGKSPSSPGYGHTASGLVIVPNTGMKVIAVDSNVIPLGSQVYVDGYGYAIAADTGGAIKGNKIDVYKDTHQLALQWGVRNVNVYVLKDEEL